MKNLKRFMRPIALALAIALLVPMQAPAAKVYAAEEVEVISSYTVEMGENAYLEYEETDDVRTVVYYENGIALQRSIYYLETGEILYYDLSRKTGNSHSRTFDMRQQNVIKYHINEFKNTQEKEIKENTTYALNAKNPSFVNQIVHDVGGGGSSKYSYLKSYAFTDEGISYNRSLYGYTDSRRYQEDYWFFEAGVAITVVSSVLGSMFNKVIEYIGTAAGILISKISVVDWLQEFFWNYQFIQSTPQTIMFDCPYEFVYHRERQVEINDEGTVIWETIYEKTQAEIEYERDAILLKPVLYM